MFVCFVLLGELELRYKLHNSRYVEVFGSNVMNLADGCLHVVAIKRRKDSISIQVHEVTAHKLTEQMAYLFLSTILFFFNCETTFCGEIMRHCFTG